jgi:phosphate transport system permease protein
VLLLNPEKKFFNPERVVLVVLLACTSVTILATFGIIFTLLLETIHFFQQISITEFFTSTKWTPLFVPKNFGVLPLIAGTFLVAVGAGLIAIPLGLGSAIYLSEFAPGKVREAIKPIIEVLAGIPTIVYGYFALTFITPVLKSFFPNIGVFNAASASIAVGIMIIPMISSLSEDAMAAVPQSIKEAAYALGSTRLEVALKVVVPAAFSGIVASFVLALSRAVGETMIVAIAAGSTPKLTVNPFDSIQTMTGYIVQVSLGDTPHGSIEYLTIFAVGMTLFSITMVMNLLAQFISKRFKEEY